MIFSLDELILKHPELKEPIFRMYALGILELFDIHLKPEFGIIEVDDNVVYKDVYLIIRTYIAIQEEDCISGMSYTTRFAAQRYADYVLPLCKDDWDQYEVAGSDFLEIIEILSNT